MAVKTTQEITLSNGFVITKIVLLSTNIKTVVCVFWRRLQDENIWYNTSQEIFDRNWIGNGCLNYILAMVTLKLKEGFSVVANSSYRSGSAGEDSCSATVCAFTGNSVSSEIVEVQLEKASVRDRKGGTKIWELAPYFYYPINEASKLLNICPTVLKKICRKYGLRRWPHRKLQSIERAIEKQHDLLEAAEKNDVTSQIENIRRQIEALHAQKEELCFGKVSFCN